MPCCSSVQMASSMNCMPCAFAADDDVLELLRGAFADDGGDGAVRRRGFRSPRRGRRRPRFFSRSWATTPRSELASMVRDLRLLVGREDVDHTIDGLAGVVGVQRAEDEQAGFRGGERELRWFPGRAFRRRARCPQSSRSAAFKPAGKVDGMLRHFALGDDAASCSGARTRSAPRP